MLAIELMKRVPLLLLVLTGCPEPSSQAMLPDAPTVCTYPRGTLNDQVLPSGDGITDRTYMVHIPTSAPCDAPLPLLVDFHGTAGGASPELAYATDELLAFAEQQQVIVARPRSRSRDGWFQWDINAGDLERNQAFARQLVADLSARFPVDTARVYASGFSSGANMAASFLADSRSPFRGVAPIAGGLWATQTLPALANGPRLYAATGYRDYLWPTARKLVSLARAAGMPEDRLHVQRTGGGHELYGWHFDELIAFLDRGERSGTGAIAPEWTEEALPAPADVNALASDSGMLVAAGADGRLWRRDAGTWTLELSRGNVDYTALCFGPNSAFVGGSHAAERRAASGWTTGQTVPDYSGMLGGAGWINAASCRDDGSIVVVGYWSAAISADGGASWSRFSAPTGYGQDHWMAGVATSSGGSTVIAGYYNYLGRSPPGSTAATSTTMPRAGWWNGITAVPGGRFWAVGDTGRIAVSTDDGLTWTPRASGVFEDLYAVHFADVQNGAAVGRRGTIAVTKDGGTSWQSRPLGRPIYLGAVYVDATTIWVGGEDGLVVRGAR
jgi:poly(3-hydroxybutyrate) depolymerase